MAYAPAAQDSSRPDPASADAERGILGGMLLDNRKISDLISAIPGPAQQHHHYQDGKPIARNQRPTGEPLFFHRANQEIFELIVAINDRDHAVDPTTLGNELARLERYEAIGGPPYIASLEEDIITTHYLGDYLRIVVDKWRLRCLLRAGESIIRDATSGIDSVEDVLEMSERKLFELSQDVETKDFQHVADVAISDMDEIEKRARHDSRSLTGLPTGFVELDKLTTGFRPSNLIILAARPSVGKSALAMNIAADVAVKQNRPVALFSLEMSSQELVQRLRCTMAGVPLGKVRANRLSRQDLEKLHHETIRLSGTPLYIDESPNLTVREMRSRARRLKGRVKNLSLLIVDYLQLMSAPHLGRGDNRQQEVSEISRALKGLARELEVPVLALSQLSRQVEQRQSRGSKDKMPKLSDLRESGAIEQDADMVIFIHRDLYDRGEQGEQARNELDLAKIRVAKQRNGPVGDFELFFDGPITHFKNISPDAYGARR